MTTPIRQPAPNVKNHVSQYCYCITSPCHLMLAGFPFTANRPLAAAVAAGRRAAMPLPSAPRGKRTRHTRRRSASRASVPDLADAEALPGVEKTAMLPLVHGCPPDLAPDTAHTDRAASGPLWRTRERTPAPEHKEKPRFFRSARAASPPGKTVPPCGDVFSSCLSLWPLSCCWHLTPMRNS